MQKLFSEHKNFIVVLILAFVLRLVFMIILNRPGFLINDDLMRYQDWGKITYEHGVADTYTTKHITFGVNPNNQPPGTVYIDAIVYSLYKLFAPPPTGSPSGYTFLLKLTSVVADIVLGILIYWCVIRNTKKKWGVIASTLYLFNPLVMYNSAVWGQIDAINNVLFFGSIMALFTKRYLASVLLFCASLFVKLSLLPLLPLYIIFLVRKMGVSEYKKMVGYFLLSFIVFLVLTLPISLNPVSWHLHFFLKNAAGELPYIANYTFNFWTVLFNPDSFALLPKSTDIYLGLPLSVWAYLLFAIVSIPIFFTALKAKKVDDTMVITCLMLLAFAVFLLLPRMHQRYIYPAIPLWAAYIGITRKTIIPYIMLSAVNFINLYVVWHPADFLPVFLTNIIAHSKIRLGMSIMTVAIFMYMYFVVFRKHLSKLR